MQRAGESNGERWFHFDKWKFSHKELVGHRRVEGEEAEKKLLGVVWNTDTDRLSIEEDVTTGSSSGVSGMIG